MKILVVGDPHGVLPKKIPKEKFDAIIILGDLGKSDTIRKIAFENIQRRRDGLKIEKYNKSFNKKVYNEIYSSAMKVLLFYSKIAPTYSLLGNVAMDIIHEPQVRQDEKQYGMKLPRLKEGMNSLKNFHLTRNSIRNINGLRIGFLDYFVDTSWIKEFDEKRLSRIKRAKKQTEKIKKILERFGKLDILITHIPPQGYLDKVDFADAPKHWQGKHGGSKTILNYIKKYQPEYVFCGHIHEAKGKAKIGETEVYNVGFAGDYFILSI
jgi:Icc-related predicted phosphoesterase